MSCSDIFYREPMDDLEAEWFRWNVALHGFACQVAIAALLTREHRRWLAYGGLGGPGEGLI